MIAGTYHYIAIFAPKDIFARPAARQN